MTYASATPRSSRRDCRGYISGMVIGLFVLVGVVMVTLSLFFTVQARRTQDARIGAQVRQLLLAAPAYAQEQLAKPGWENRDLQVQTPVENATLTLTFARTPAGTALVTATARLGERRNDASQQLEFSIPNDGSAPRLLESRLLHAP